MNKLILRSLLLALLVLFFAATPDPSSAQVAVGISVGFAPPELPVYVQPVCPGLDYIWTPGYWAYTDDDGYYWVPGTWVLAPEPGFLWTPPYWAWREDRFVFIAGYWGPVVGFYGGVNYGYGYFGRGFEGGRWEHDHFFYNREVTNVNTTIINNTYNTTIVNTNVTRVSYNGGQGGLTARASAQEEAAARERHIAPVAAQARHVEEARANRDLRASVNNGKPPIAATGKPGEFKGREVVAAKEGGAVHQPAGHENTTNRPAPEHETRPGNPPAHETAPAHPNPVHPNEATPHERPSTPNTGNAKQDQKFQQQQEKLAAKQEQEHQTLQQKQDQEHQRTAQQHADQARQQQMEQRHQQQTQQMEQRHQQQTEQMQGRQQPKSAPPPSRQQPSKESEKKQ